MGEIQDAVVEGMVKLLILFLLLSLAAGSDISMYVAGNFSGEGYNESYIDAPGANVTKNGSAWLVVWNTTMFLYDK